ncbi:CBL-interacting kinase 4-like protein [Labeo rohita]|uniref:CBL-interacting kinase 4-like protein n=1 Tax=Labeo rohita TaxID=84645 RepID=A0A498NKG9_LABRO|nr:CBL-interacting kinase 4-like protein [Labeo rohita]
MVPYKAASYNVRKAVKEAKQHYGRKLESQLQQNNSRSLWQGLRAITDYKAPTSGMMNADVTLADELNTFYGRFEAAAKDAKDANASGANGCRHEDTASTGNTFIISEHDDRRALQRVVRSAERTIHTELPDLHSIYSRRCWTKARKIVKDLSHPNNGLFSLMRSGKRFRSLKANTERLRRSFFPQAIRSLNQYITQY